MAETKQTITRIIHQNECNTLAPSSSSKLTYQDGVDDQTSQLYICISENSGGGFFSNKTAILLIILTKELSTTYNSKVGFNSSRPITLCYQCNTN